MLSHKNNFDFLRLLAAFMVLFSHQHNLLGIPEAHFDPRITPGPIGVAIFFSISGYLVIQGGLKNQVQRFANPAAANSMAIASSG
ncbi:acyltransferase family protein, partial [Burkholderia ubonensis]